MQTIYDFIEQKIKEKGFSKKQVYSKLGMTEAGFKRTLQNENLSIKKYQHLADILGFNPIEFFKNDKIVLEKQYNNLETDSHLINYVSEPSQKNHHIIKENPETIRELMTQNSKLIDIIQQLTK